MEAAAEAATPANKILRKFVGLLLVLWGVETLRNPARQRWIE
jgi:hypothetical protein